MFLRPSLIIQELREKKYVLPGMVGADFGCGGGYFTSLLAQEVGLDGKIYAIDIQEDALKETQEFLKNLNLRNVKFLKEDLEVSSGLEKESVDFVFISQLLYQTKEPEKVILEAKKVLKNRGHLIILEPQEKNPLFTNQKILSLEDTINLVEKNNFKIVEVKTIGDYYLLISEK